MDLVLSIIALILSIAALCLSIYRYIKIIKSERLYKKQQIKDFVSEIIELQKTELDNATKEEKEKNNKQE